MVEKRVSGLTRFIFKSPEWYKVLFCLLLFVAIISTVAFQSGQIQDRIIKGMAIIALPAIAAALITPPITRIFGGIMNLNRSSILALFTSMVLTFVILLSSVLERTISSGVQPSVTNQGIALGLGLILGLRLAMLQSTSNTSALRMALPSALQTLITIPVLGEYIPPDTLPGIYARILVSCAVFALGSILFVQYINSPMQKSIGFKTTDFIQSLISHLTHKTPQMEELLSEMGSSADIPVVTMALRGSGDDKRLKAVFSMPMIHPGPLGEIGGGTLQKQLDAALKTNDCTVVFPYHSTAHHDFNPTMRSELDKITGASHMTLEKLEYSHEATDSVRVFHDGVEILGQRFANNILLVASTPDILTDDIEFAVGLGMMNAAKHDTVRNVGIVDAHNSGGEESLPTLQGSKVSYRLIDAASETSRKLVEGEARGFLAGAVQQKTKYTADEGMGELGIRTTLVKTHSGQRTAYILLDGNNLVPGLRGEILKNLFEAGLVDNAEIMTTDTHTVNMNTAHNYIGARIDHEELIGIVEKTVKEAAENLEPCEAGMNTEIAEDVQVFGAHRTAELLGVTSTLLAVSGYIGVINLTAATILTILLYQIMP